MRPKRDVPDGFREAKESTQKRVPGWLAGRIEGRSCEELAKDVELIFGRKVFLPQHIEASTENLRRILKMVDPDERWLLQPQVLQTRGLIRKILTLWEYGYSLDEMLTLPKEELTKCSGIGPKTIRRIRETLASIPPHTKE